MKRNVWKHPSWFMILLTPRVSNVFFQILLNSNFAKLYYSSLLHFCKSFSDYVSNSIVRSKVKLFLHRYYFNSYSKICLRKVFLNVTKDSFWTLFGTYHNHVPKTELTKVSLPNCKNYFSSNFEMFRLLK